MRHDYTIGGTGVRLSNDLQGIVDAVLRDGPMAVGAAIRVEVTRVAEAAEPQVPMRTGRLRASLGVETRISMSSAAVAVVFGGSTAPYAYYVKGKRKGGGALAGKSVWQELVRKPSLAAAERAARSGTTALLDVIERGSSR